MIIGQMVFNSRKARLVEQIIATLLLCVSQTYAFEIGTSNPDLKARWDNTLKYSTAWRMKSPDTTLSGSRNVNDGDSNFNKGLISNRLDLLSEFEMSYQNLGFRLDGAAWYDNAYLHSNDHAKDGSVNQLSVPYNQFTLATQKDHGSNAELLDAFAYAKLRLGDDPVTVRLGKHSLVWGESLFFGANAIAGGMMPVDVVKMVSVPNTQFKEALRPVQQISSQIQLNSNVLLAGYYQFRWEANRLPAVGSYFSQTDTNPNGAEQILLGLPTPPFLQANEPRGIDQLARNSGQGGLQMRLRSSEIDYGIYLIRFNNKNFQQITDIGLRPVTGVFPGPGCVVPGSVKVGASSCARPGMPVAYHLAYNEGITALGGSLSRTFGDMNLAAEASIRHNQDLASTLAVDTSAMGGAITNNNSNPAYAVGNTAHLNLSTLWSLSPNALFREANFVGELAWNRVLSVTKNRAALDPNATRDAVALRWILEPIYRQVLPGFDLGLPIGLGYAPHGSRSMALGPGAQPADGSGDASIGLNGSYLEVWRFSLSYTHYYGGVQPFINSNNNFSYGQSLKDRDFIAFSLRRTF